MGPPLSLYFGWTALLHFLYVVGILPLPHPHILKSIPGMSKSLSQWVLSQLFTLKMHREAGKCSHTACYGPH